MFIGPNILIEPNGIDSDAYNSFRMTLPYTMAVVPFSCSIEKILTLKPNV
jgi:hypothetical protein